MVGVRFPARAKCSPVGVSSFEKTSVFEISSAVELLVLGLLKQSSLSGLAAANSNRHLYTYGSVCEHNSSGRHGQCSRPVVLLAGLMVKSSVHDAGCEAWL